MSQPISHDDFIYAEFHCHTVYSFDSSNRIPDLLQAARDKGIDKLAITDHDTITGARIAKNLDPDLTIIGEEIMTTQGEILGYFLEEEIPPQQEPMRVIEQLKKQGAFIALPHPMDIMRHGWNIHELTEILPYVDALEVFNSRSLRRDINLRAQELAEKHGKAMIAGSDAHSLVELGLALMQLPDFRNANELRIAINISKISGKLLSPMEHFRASLQIMAGRLTPFKKTKDERN